MKTHERIVKIVPFNELADPVKEKVVSTFRSWLNDVYKILVTKAQIGQMFHELNTLVEFFVLTEGVNGSAVHKRLFRVDDTDQRLAKFLAEQFAISSIGDPQIQDKILMNMIKRNEGDARLKFK